MRITYKLGKEDYFKFNLHHMENFPKVKRSIMIQRFLMPLVFTIIAFLTYSKGRVDTSTILLVYLVGTLGWIILYPRFLARSMKKRLDSILDLEENKMLLEERTIEVTDQGIYEIVLDDGKEKSLFASDQVIDVEKSGDSIYIYLPSEAAYIIPTKFFEDGQEEDKFIGKVEKLKK